MEPSWSLKDIRLIFADQFVTNSLLVKLGIENSCTLRGDYYHLYNEVWPKPDNFGQVCMAQCGPRFRKMISSPDKKVWISSYKSIAKYLQLDPIKLEKLDNIYNNPGYYAGYFLRNIEGNRVFRGSVPAEQNHSSVIAYLGEGGNSSIMEHM